MAAEWGFADIAGDCELVTAEIVTNAVRAATAVPARGASLPVQLRLSARPGRIRVEVWDASDDMPRPGREAVPDEPGGWGLILVDALSQQWGAYRTAGGGKCVFAVVAQ